MTELLERAITKLQALSESEQDAIGETVLGGDRCVAQLTTLLHRIVTFCLWSRKVWSATAEQQRWAASREGRKLPGCSGSLRLPDSSAFWLLRCELVRRLRCCKAASFYCANYCLSSAKLLPNTALQRTVDSRFV